MVTSNCGDCEFGYEKDPSTGCLTCKCSENPCHVSGVNDDNNAFLIKTIKQIIISMFMILDMSATL